LGRAWSASSRISKLSLSPAQRRDGLDGFISLCRHNALSGQRRRLGNELCEAPQVLGDGCQSKLVLCPARATESKAIEPQDALQVAEPHLDAVALAAGLLEVRGADERSSDITSALVDAARLHSSTAAGAPPRSASGIRPNGPSSVDRGCLRENNGPWASGNEAVFKQECLHRVKVHLASLAERYGADLPMAELVKRAVCSGPTGDTVPFLTPDTGE
jgi:hypothetical protein